MVGIVGTIGEVPDLSIDSHLRWSRRERSKSFDGHRLSLRGSFHGDTADVHAVETPDGSVIVWVLGEVYGYDQTATGTGTYVSRPADLGSAPFCARLYAEHGIDFVGGLNGNFLLVVYDDQAETLYTATDRLGSIPLFQAGLNHGRAVATSIQTVARHPNLDPEFDVPYLHEYLVFKRSFGRKTPLTGIERHPPATVTAYDLAADTVDTTRYWQPRFDPVEKPFDYFVDRFVDTFRAILDEWVSDDQRYGLLLSGGSDSRLCLAGLDDTADITALHMSGWMSREARMAERVALTAGASFKWLRRHDEYQTEALERNPRISNFNGWFSQAYVTGFHDEIVDEFDVLVSGMYADTLFKGHALPSPSVDLGRLGEFALPIEDRVTSVEEYIDSLMTGISDEIDLPTDLRTVLENNIEARDDGIDHHGIRYDSIDDLVHCAKWYPLTNDDDMIFWDSLHHLRPYRTPYLDNRMIDLALEMPRKYQIRRNIINRALERLSPALADIPHAHTGVKPARSFPVEYIGSVSNAFWQKHIQAERPPKRFLSNGPWVDDAELLRTHDFAREALARNEQVVRSLPFLDWSDVMDCYDRHLAGENRIVELYGLLTLLEMPVTKQIALGDPPTERTAQSEPKSALSQPSPAGGESGD